MVIGWEPDENLVLAMENKNECFASISDGALIPPETIQVLLSELLRHVRATAAEEPPKSLQKSDPRFKELH